MSKRIIPGERMILFLVGAVQFVNILDFMMVMPLGPDFAAALGIPSSQLGLIGGSYTAAAAVSGLAGALFLDRFDRRNALAVAMLGLVMGTAAGAMATGLTSLVTARVVAGLFGGPATSLSLSIIADLVPPQRRGKAMGAVMGAFSVASVLGVPGGLELARLGGWRAPFIAVAGLGAVVALGAIWLMPPLRLHLESGLPRSGLRGLGRLLQNRLVLLALLTYGSVMMAGFSVIPNISPYLIQNLGYPRQYLGLLYLVGGAVSFGVMRLTGRAVDKFGAAPVSLVGTLLLLADIYLWFAAFALLRVPVMVLFVCFMVAMSMRNVSLTTLSSRVPAAAERAGFMSLQSTAQHVASAAGAFLSSRLLHDLPDGTLGGMNVVAGVAMALAAALPMLLAVIERRVRARA
jgi:predicted MFS family arabinose efflux permease